VDILSEVLNAIRLTGAVFLDLELREQWSYLTAPARKIADALMPEADHVIPYHLLTEGTCYARLVDGEPVELHAGDLILFPREIGTCWWRGGLRHCASRRSTSQASASASS